MSGTSTSHISTVPFNALVKFKPFIVGDLHISDKYSARHVDYFRDCIEFLEQITEEIKKNEVTHLILTGDLIGRTTEKNLQHRDSLLYMMKTLQIWNDLTNGNVYSIRGNHDYSDRLTDFELFVSLGFIKTCDHLDVGLIRFHMIDYGEYARKITLDPDKYNVAIMHTNLQVDGATNWFRGGNDGVELSSLENLKGVSFVVAGHIHDPSVRLVRTSIGDQDISLFYPGNGTRPRQDPNIWDKCFGLLFITDDNDVDMKQIEFNLRPASEIFASTFDDIVEDEDLPSDNRAWSVEDLALILEELKSYNVLGDSDYRTQVIQLGGLDKEAVDLALEYIGLVEGEMK